MFQGKKRKTKSIIKGGKWKKNNYAMLLMGHKAHCVIEQYDK